MENSHVSFNFVELFLWNGCTHKVESQRFANMFRLVREIIPRVSNVPKTISKKKYSER